jgi:hypothetical protein
MTPDNSSRGPNLVSVRARTPRRLIAKRSSLIAKRSSPRGADDSDV